MIDGHVEDGIPPAAAEGRLQFVKSGDMLLTTGEHASVVRPGCTSLLFIPKACNIHAGAFYSTLIPISIAFN